MAMDQMQTFEWLRHRVYDELEPEVADLRAQLATATARVQALEKALANHECPLGPRVVWCGKHGVYHPESIDKALGS